jgi:DNA-binding Xre family transcriptional regulator
MANLPKCRQYILLHFITLPTISQDNHTYIFLATLKAQRRVEMITAKKHELKGRMARSGFSGVDIARETKLSQSFVSQMISGKRNVSPATARKICLALRCEFDDVFDITEQSQPP